MCFEQPIQDKFWFTIYIYIYNQSYHNNNDHFCHFQPSSQIQSYTVIHVNQVITKLTDWHSCITTSTVVTLMGIFNNTLYYLCTFAECPSSFYTVFLHTRNMKTVGMALLTEILRKSAVLHGYSMLYMHGRSPFTFILPDRWHYHAIMAL